MISTDQLVKDLIDQVSSIDNFGNVLTTSQIQSILNIDKLITGDASAGITVKTKPKEEVKQEPKQEVKQDAKIKGGKELIHKPEPKVEEDVKHNEEPFYTKPHYFDNMYDVITAQHLKKYVNANALSGGNAFVYNSVKPMYNMYPYVLNMLN